MWPHVCFLGVSCFVRCRQLSHCGVVLVQQPCVSGEQLVAPVPLSAGSSAAASPSAPDTPGKHSAETSSCGGISVSRHHGEVWLFGGRLLSRNTPFILGRGGQHSITFGSPWSDTRQLVLALYSSLLLLSLKTEENDMKCPNVFWINKHDVKLIRCFNLTPSQWNLWKQARLLIWGCCTFFMITTGDTRRPSCLYSLLELFKQSLKMKITCLCNKLVNN